MSKWQLSGLYDELEIPTHAREALARLGISSVGYLKFLADGDAASVGVSVMQIRALKARGHLADRLPGRKTPDGVLEDTKKDVGADPTPSEDTGHPFLQLRCSHDHHDIA